MLQQGVLIVNLDNAMCEMVGMLYIARCQTPV